MKRLIVSGTDDPLWTSSINPVDRPRPPRADQPRGRGHARAGDRTDLQQSKNNLKISDIDLRYQSTQPAQLNLTANYGLNGLGGPQFISAPPDPQTGIRAPSQTIPSGYFDALRNIGGFDAPTWTIGFTFPYPLGQSAQEPPWAVRSSVAADGSEYEGAGAAIATDVTDGPELARERAGKRRRQ